jgi:signal transduction histidine kinase
VDTEEIRQESQEIHMSQSTVSSYESLVLDPAFSSNTQDFVESSDFLSPKKHGSPYWVDLEAIASWSTMYGFRGGSSRPWAGAAFLPGSMNSQQAANTQTARAVEDAIVAERNRLARELHDAVTQTLFAASLIAEVLPDLWDMDEMEARKSTEELRQLTRGALAEMRTLLFELRPAALSQAHLYDLLRQLSEAVTGRKGLPICLDVAGDCEIPCSVKVEIYRIVQESLNNVVKYARATQVEIKVRLDENHVHIEIKDNGVGFDPGWVKPTSLGLRIMHERAEGIQAQLQIISQPDLGTTVILDWQR